MARTFALIALVRPILHRVSCSYETIPNAPKHYETQQKKNLGSNGKDCLRLLPKITWLCVTNLYINCTSSPSFAPSFLQLWNATKCTKHYATHQNICLGSNGVDLVRSLWKIRMWIRGTNFYINSTNLHRFAPSFMQSWNDPKCTQTLCNAPKNEFIVQWGGSGVFVVKNCNVNLWHKLLH